MIPERVETTDKDSKLKIKPLATKNEEVDEKQKLKGDKGEKDKKKHVLKEPLYNTILPPGLQGSDINAFNKGLRLINAFIELVQKSKQGAIANYYKDIIKTARILGFGPDLLKKTSSEL